MSIRLRMRETSSMANPIATPIAMPPSATMKNDIEACANENDPVTTAASAKR